MLITLVYMHKCKFEKQLELKTLIGQKWQTHVFAVYCTDSAHMLVSLHRLACHVLFLTLFPASFSVNLLCQSALHITGTDSEAHRPRVMNGSELGNRTLLLCCIHSCMTATIHPAEVSFIPPKSAPSGLIEILIYKTL